MRIREFTIRRNGWRSRANWGTQTIWINRNQTENPRLCLYHELAHMIRGEAGGVFSEYSEYAVTNEVTQAIVNEEAAVWRLAVKEWKKRHAFTEREARIIRKCFGTYVKAHREKFHHGR